MKLSGISSKCNSKPKDMDENKLYFCSWKKGQFRIY